MAPKSSAKSMLKGIPGYRPIKKADWQDFWTLDETAKLVRQTDQVKRARKLLAIAQRLAGVAEFVVRSEATDITDDCVDRAWQIALAQLELCQAIFGQGSEYCYQQFQIQLALLLAPCDETGGVG